MTDEKKNVIIGVGLSIAAVVVLWLFIRNRSNDIVATDTIDPTATADPGAGYTNYNLAPYPPVVSNPYVKTPTNDCCDTCNSTFSNGGVSTDIAAYNALMDDLNV